MTLRVRAGPSLDSLQDITDKVNKDIPVNVVSAAFEGRLAVYVKGLDDANEPEYFQREGRKGITWSIQFQGRFLQSHSANDILFGNIFDKPLNLPSYVTTPALALMERIDPTLESHIQSQDKPSALSPLITTMPHLHHKRIPHAKLSAFHEFPSAISIADDVSQLDVQGDAVGELVKVHTAAERRALFSNKDRRLETTFGPDDILSADFCYGYLQMDPEPAFHIPYGPTFSIERYWGIGRPITFVCCKRNPNPALTEQPWREVFWCISIEIVEEEQDDAGQPEQQISDDID